MVSALTHSGSAFGKNKSETAEALRAASPENPGRESGRSGTLLFWLGAAAVCMMAAPYLLLGTDSVVNYHDQLDGEIIAYLLQAKHLFSGSTLPEFMGGASKTALTAPAPLCVLLFLGGRAFWAYVVMQLAGSLTGYVGMYLLARRVTGKVLPSVAAGVLFAYLPFLPVYGLSQYGIPLLLWFFLEMREGRRTRSGPAYGVIYALCSSLVLVGFGVLGLLAAGILWRFLRRKRKGGFTAAVTWLLMLAVYTAENAGLLGQLLGGGEISHKAEYVLEADNIWESFITAFLQGGQHSADYHVLIPAAAAAVLILAVLRVKGAGRGLVKVSLILLGWNAVFAAAAALWNGGPGILLRTQLRALGAFQLERVLWIAPAFWYLLLACVLALAGELWRYAAHSGRKAAPGAGGVSVPGVRGESVPGAWGEAEPGAWGKPEPGAGGEAEPGVRGESVPHTGSEPVPQAGGEPMPHSRREALLRLCAGLAAAAAVFALALTGVTVLKESNLKPNIQKLLNPQYKALSYKDYYALGVMDQVLEYIREKEGLEPSEYRVASLGIDPAAALYAGFYTLDGYSNNYSLDYKRRFREIIAPELDKSEYLRSYFDGWGNRCYLLSAESPAYYTIEKGGFFFQDLRLNMKSFRALGGRYVLSAAYIANAGETGLIQVREEPFETEDSYYRIYLYKAAGD